MQLFFRNERERKSAIAELEKLEGNYTIEVTKMSESAFRTAQQNKALHKWLTMVADQFNSSGLDMRVVLEHHPEISWTTLSVKEKLFKPIQKSMTGKESTAQANRVEYSDVCRELHRHFAQKHGVQLPEWPSLR